MRSAFLFALLTAALLGCGAARSATGSGKPTGGSVAVLYAGSLVNLMEHDLGPGFDSATPYHFQGFAGGSLALANQISGKLRRADVFISAVPQVNSNLMGPDHGDWVRWYLTFAEAPLVIGYNPNSRFAAALKSKPWYEVMTEPGFRLGRTDPKLDPKGALTIKLVQQAADYYHQPGLAERILGSSENPAQVFPEETLVGRLQAGQLDAGFFYSNEAAEAHIPDITPPDAIMLRASYTVTVLRDAPNAPGGTAFVQFLLSSQGQAILKRHGLTLLQPTLSGDPAALPPALRPLLEP